MLVIFSILLPLFCHVRRPGLILVLKNPNDLVWSGSRYSVVLIVSVGAVLTTTLGHCQINDI